MLVVKDSDRVFISESSSKGNQLKFYIDNKWIKLDYYSGKGVFIYV